MSINKNLFNLNSSYLKSKRFNILCSVTSKWHSPNRSVIFNKKISTIKTYLEYGRSKSEKTSNINQFLYIFNKLQ